MATVASGIDQVLTRIREENNSRVASLPAGTGPNTDTIASDDQIATFLSEGNQILSRSDLLQLRGSATLAVSSGTRRVEYAAMTSTPTNGTLWSCESGTWTITSSGAVTSVRRAGISMYPNYYPLGTETGVPQHVFDGGSHVMIGPFPNADGTLLLRGRRLSRVLTTGGDFDDCPDVLLHHLYAFACWRVCQAAAGNPAFEAQLPRWRDEIAPWAGPFLGLGGS
jgi:hypothetical protein